MYVSLAEINTYAFCFFYQLTDKKTSNFKGVLCIQHFINLLYFSTVIKCHLQLILTEKCLLPSFNNSQIVQQVSKRTKAAGIVIKNIIPN